MALTHQNHQEDFLQTTHVGPSLDLLNQHFLEWGSRMWIFRKILLLVILFYFRIQESVVCDLLVYEVLLIYETVSCCWCGRPASENGRKKMLQDRPS